MAIQSFTNEMKGRVGHAGRQTQDVVKTYIQINRRAYGTFFGNAQTLAKAELNNARQFYDTAFERFNEARQSGVRDVVFMPVSMAPVGRDTLFSAVRDARVHFVKTRDELLDIYRRGYQDIWGSLTSTKAEVKTVATKTVRQARKTSAGAKSEVKQAAGKASKETRQAANAAKKEAGQATAGAQARKTATTPTRRKPASTRAKTAKATGGTKPKSTGSTARSTPTKSDAPAAQAKSNTAQTG